MLGKGVGSVLLRIPILSLLLCAFSLGLGCTHDNTPQSTMVVVYTSLDRVFSEPILERFEAQTGIPVRPLYDTEAAKTTGLVNRIIAESGTPKCDVFWNSEWVRTLVLAKRGLLAPYESPSADDIPKAFKDPDVQGP